MIYIIESFFYKIFNLIKLKKRLKTIKKERTNIKSIIILYYIPKTNIEKYNNWEDGFTKAVDLLSNEYTIKWINLEDYKPTVKELNNYDLIIAKSCWNWIVDDYLSSLSGISAYKAIAVSCSKSPKYRSDIWKYDIIWYEMEEYMSKVISHPNKFQAFGINSDKFYPQNLEKKIDILSIGMLEPYKRFEKLNKKEGKIKIIIGDKHSINSDKVIQLLDKNIQIIDYTSQQKLAEYINMSKLVYIPSNIDGGGERAVLEAKACGVKVEVENDNPKLVKLLNSNKAYTIEDYYYSLNNAIKSLI